MIEIKEIEELLKSGANPNLICREFELKPTNIALYIAAIANTGDGYIVIGAHREVDGYSINGISSTFKFEDVLSTSINMLSIEPIIESERLHINGKHVFVIKVKKSTVRMIYEDKIYIVENNEIIRMEEQLMDMTKVFVVHGHDNGAKQEAARFIEKLGLEAIILHEQVSKGKTIIEKIEENTNVGFAVVLYTPCDLGKAKDNQDYKARARQNVVFEHGYLIGKLGRDRVSALVKGDIEKPNDISGVVYIEMDNGEGWKLALAREMKSVGYEIDLNKIG